MGRYVLGITGASGTLYAARLLEHLKALGHEVQVVLSESGRKVAAHEGHPRLDKAADKAYDNQDFFAAIASGSYAHQGMAVIPCSMGTLGKLAHGIGDTLLTRAADVCLKEKRRLVIIPREAPMSLIHLRNQAVLAEAGATIIPASPSFYHHPKTIEDLVDTVLSRVLDHLGVEHQVGRRWRSG
ncbi:MAG TPA: UbiX family flavin prenyltransferase [Fibrobacteria bacterium]|nr:UbiX family flavin prenyltransferase [Fibrobacteria bacterium]